MSRKPIIALLCDFPYWVLDSSLRRPSGHYAVWLVALYEVLKNIQDYEIHWICFYKGIRRTLTAVHEGQVFHVLPAGSLSLSAYSRYWWDQYRVKRLLKKLKPDILHAWGTESRYAICAQAFEGKKILSMQGILSAYHERCPLGPFQYKQSLTERKLLPQFSVITSESRWGCDMCRLIAPDACILRWEYAAEERFFATERCLRESPICLMAGTDTPIKNVETAVKAFSSPELAHVQLFIAGVSPEAHPLFPSNVHALGRVSRERMVELLQATWALVHPSLADTSPNIVKEARVMGVPVVTSTDCGGAQYVEEGKSGFIIPAKDVNAMKQAVLAMTADRDTSLRMGEWGREECRRLLSRETMLNRLMEIYDALLQNKVSTLS